MESKGLCVNMKTKLLVYGVGRDVFEKSGKYPVPSAAVLLAKIIECSQCKLWVH